MRLRDADEQAERVPIARGVSGFLNAIPSLLDLQEALGASLCSAGKQTSDAPRKNKGEMLGSPSKVRTTPLSLLLPCLILLIARVNGSDIIWRPQTRLSSSLRLPCSQHHYPCRVYDVKFCAARKHTYLSAAAWDNAAHVWGLSGCPPRQANCYFEMYTSSASRGEVCLTSSSCFVLVLAVTKLA